MEGPMACITASFHRAKAGDAAIKSVYASSPRIEDTTPYTATSAKLRACPFKKGPSPTASTHSWIASINCFFSSEMLYFFLSLLWAIHMATDPPAWLTILVPTSNVGTSLTYLKASHESPRVRVALGKISTANSLSTHWSHLHVSGSAMAARKAGPAWPLWAASEAKMSVESLTCCPSINATGTFLYPSENLSSFLLSGFTSTVLYGIFCQSRKAFTLQQNGQISY
mmetsp:Transcript_67954/g.208200  ORF Transcript_67954/g.208200 Transcript_67954/m.208200 type:complete len:226 (+) Transcript_67954:232-909(+)